MTRSLIESFYFVCRKYNNFFRAVYFDIINNLTNASLRSGGSIHLDTGEEFGVDEESAMVLTTYLKTLTTEEQEGFIATLRRDERGFMKAVEEATYNLSRE